MWASGWRLGPETGVMGAGGLGAPSSDPPPPSLFPSERTLKERPESVGMANLYTPLENQESMFKKKQKTTRKTKWRKVQKKSCTLVVFKIKTVQGLGGRWRTPRAEPLLSSSPPSSWEPKPPLLAREASRPMSLQVSILWGVGGGAEWAYGKRLGSANAGLVLLDGGQGWSSSTTPGGGRWLTPKGASGHTSPGDERRGGERRRVFGHPGSPLLPGVELSVPKPVCPGLAVEKLASLLPDALFALAGSAALGERRVVCG